VGRKRLLEAKVPRRGREAEHFIRLSGLVTVSGLASQSQLASHASSVRDRIWIETRGPGSFSLKRGLRASA